MNFQNSNQRTWKEGGIGRNLTSWITLQFPDLPDDIYRGAVNYELLPADTKAIALSTVQGTYITQPDILGGYEAEYQFKIIYRIKPGNSTNEKLMADELLNHLGEWIMTQKPDIGEGLHVDRIEPTTQSALFAAYDNGDEDHQIFFRMTYQKPAEF